LGEIGAFRHSVFANPVNNVQLPCPRNIDDLALAYVMRRLSPRRRATLEEHCLGCLLCADRLRAWSDLISAIQRLLKDVDDHQKT
jgi:hypothetical protein